MANLSPAKVYAHGNNSSFVVTCISLPGEYTLYMLDSDRGLVPNRGPLPRSRANSTSGANSDRTIPQRGPISLSAETPVPFSQFAWDDKIRFDEHKG